MTNAELAEMLNREFDLKGRKAVTPDIVRQWVLWSVLPSATAKSKGRAWPIEWSRNDEAMRRARRLAEWRRYEVTRKTAVVAQAYFEWGYDDFDEAKRAIVAEFKRARSKLLRGVTSDTQIDQYSELSAARKKALRKQAGPLDHRLEGTSFQFLPELILQSLSVFTADNNKEAILSSLINKQLTEMSMLENDTRVNSLASFMALCSWDLCGGKEFTDFPGEVVAERATKSDYSLARRMIIKGYFIPLTSMPDILDILPYAKNFRDLDEEIGRQVKVGSFAILGFVGLLNGVAKYKTRRSQK